MRKICILFFALAIVSCKTNTKEQAETNKADEVVAVTETNKEETMQEAETIYQFKIEDLSGEEFDFSTLQGKKVMVVNTASECGNTPQYKNLQALYETYKDKGFTIVGFPANNFGAQEPGTNEQIAAFCEKNYGVTFPMMSKISVKGDDMHDVYKFLTEKKRNGFEDSQVGWNFQKYLIDENGHVVRVVDPKTMPDEESIVNWIKS